ncbi:MAG TPA: hypothetical protein DDW51_05700 [Cyanobacteria bacterium UBA11367]|nr:hypothetical protein [Cyanobacteria bacterium UBA11367]HBE56777.1 hypothetical protein [Cyanobacteria bacterium UBA11366]HBK83945.1 hypothetical protein [Flavobacterium sp.]HCA95982.1 hypothetical protein [Cyanobacteria bacterium UBA9226]
MIIIVNNKQYEINNLIQALELDIELTKEALELVEESDTLTEKDWKKCLSALERSLQLLREGYENSEIANEIEKMDYFIDQTKLVNDLRKNDYLSIISPWKK